MPLINIYFRPIVSTLTLTTTPTPLSLNSMNSLPTGTSVPKGRTSYPTGNGPIPSSILGTLQGYRLPSDYEWEYAAKVPNKK